MKGVATNIRLPRKTLDALKIEAVKRRTSLAQLIREAVQVAYGIGDTGAGVDPKSDPIYKLMGSFSSGRRDSAENHDEIYDE